MTKALTSPTGKDITLRAIRPNAGVEAAYRKALQGMIAEMANSTRYWLRATWNANPPRPAMMAHDASPIQALRKTMERLGRHWIKRFDKMSRDVAANFADKSFKHADIAMQQALKDAGFTVKFRRTEHMDESFQAVLAENVGLIKSIPEKYLAEVQVQVWQSVQSGHDLATLSKGLQHRYGITYKRAALIARDQSAKAAAVMERTRRLDLGIVEAEWLHSGAGHEPRQSHVAATGKRYKVAEGCYIDGEYIMPGQLINCRCVSKSVIPGFED